MVRRLRERLAAQILASRQVTKRIAIERLRAELSVLGADLTITAPVGIRPHEVRRANAIARRMMLLRGEAIGEGLTRSAIFGKLEQRAGIIAATEPGNALNAERSMLMQSSPEFREWGKRWDATGDRNMCPICERADGDIVMMSDSFPAGVPGAVHPSCYCEETYLAPWEFGPADLRVQPRAA